MPRRPERTLSTRTGSGARTRAIAQTGPGADARRRAGVSRRLRVMLSSRSSDAVPTPAGGTMLLADLRARMKDALQELEVGGWHPFEVWINEDEPPQEGSRDAWDHCLDQASRADLVIALVNGNAGWSADEAGEGICHAELKRAFDSAPAKVRAVRIPGPATRGAKHERFREWVERQHLWMTRADDAVAALERVREAAVDGLTALAQAGTRELRRGKWHAGDALEWSRLDFAERAERMEEALRSAVRDRGGSEERAGVVVAQIRGHVVLLRLGAVPGPLAVGPARERLGQPFLRDHELAPALRGRSGPVHLVACQRGATEAQATRILGFPDATLVSAPFGVYVADPIQGIQMLLLSNCRDAASTRIAVARAFEWLDASGEAELLVQRARRRARVVAAMGDGEVGDA
jgi:hypothetical protein